MGHCFPLILFQRLASCNFPKALQVLFSNFLYQGNRTGKKMLRYYSSWGQAFKIMENYILLGVYMFERAKT